MILRLAQGGGPAMVSIVRARKPTTFVEPMTADRSLSESL
jgi:hypothetical protein